MVVIFMSLNSPETKAKFIHIVALKAVMRPLEVLIYLVEGSLMDNNATSSIFKVCVQIQG